MRFSVEMIVKWRQNAQWAWATQSHADTPEGWSISLVDLSKVVTIFPALRVKQGMALRAYRYRQGSNGHSIVFAMPASVCLPTIGAKVEQTPRPATALDDIMEAVDGDGSLESYLQASILRRELNEFGTFGHGANWALFHVLGDAVWAEPPLQSVSPTQTTPSGTADMWQWIVPQPEDYCPSVDRKYKIVKVIFYVYSALGQEKIILYEDVFHIGGYIFQTDSQTIATSPNGYVI